MPLTKDCAPDNIEDWKLWKNMADNAFIEVYGNAQYFTVPHRY